MRIRNNEFTNGTSFIDLTLSRAIESMKSFHLTFEKGYQI